MEVVVRRWLWWWRRRWCGSGDGVGMQMVVVYSTPSLLPEDECGAQQDPRHINGRLQVLGVGELAVDAHADGDGCECAAPTPSKMYGPGTDAVLVLKAYRRE